MHDTNLLEDQPIAWTPTPDVIERAQLTRFMRQVGLTTWDELYEFSIRDVEKFTEQVLRFLDIEFDPPYDRLMDVSEGVEFPRWFSTGFPQSRKDAKEEDGLRQQESEPGAVATGSAANAEREVRNAESAAEPRRHESEPGAVATGSHAGLNITTMCLDRWQTDEMKDQLAVICEREDGKITSTSYAILLREVEYAASGLKALGFVEGDAIGIHLPMIVETVVALLAVNRIGAIAVPVFSGYGVEAIASRLNAVGAKGLFTCDGFTRRGKLFNAFEVAKEAVSLCPSVKKVFVANAGDSIDYLPDRTDDERFIEFDDLILWGENPKSPSLEPTSAEDPLIILYTSGTTGKPKGIAHTHASFPIKAAQDMAFGTDVGRGTRICWYTDIGWMMGPWLIYGALINGATICIYDGAPDYPTPDRMWEFCATQKIEVLGISPTLVRALAAREEAGATGTPASCRREGEARKSDSESVSQLPISPDGDDAGRMPAFQRHDLSSLRMFASTGEPWNPAPWWWLFKEVGNSKLPIINYSGGTEIAGGILMGNPLLPIKPCSFPAPCPGMDVDILDEEGNPVGPNQVGELVLRQPWIGMARGFWQERERYLDTYWRRFPNIWVHGDWAMRDKDGHWFILGRSDDTLKVAGKRVGPAEVESLLVAHPLVTEAAVIGVPDEKKGTAMVAFCVVKDEGGRMKDEAEVPGLKSQVPDDSSFILPPSSLEAELKALVAKDMGKPLAPSRIHFVSALPKTRNAKVMRRVIRAGYLGEDPGDLSALENPRTVQEIQRFNKKAD
jgi:acetyl-CoA synthetase